MKMMKWIVSFCIATIFIFGVYLMQVVTVKIIRLDKSFMFLTVHAEGVEACLAQVQLDGGAGFLLKTGKIEKVALAVYLQEENGILVKERLSKTYNSVQIEKISVPALYFQGIHEKQTANTIYSAFQNFYTMIERLESIIYEIDNGATQESSKRKISVIFECFSIFSKTYQDDFKEFSALCKNATSALNNCIDGICYTKNLRYILCEWCVAYVELSNQFSL